MRLAWQAPSSASSGCRGPTPDAARSRVMCAASQVASVEPLLLLRHKTFYLRRSCDPFDRNDPSKSTRAAHLTNISLQKHHPRFGEDSVWDGHQVHHFQTTGSICILDGAAARPPHAGLSCHSPAIYWLLAPSNSGSKQFGAFLKQRAGGAVSPDSVLADIDALMVICFKAVLPMHARDRGCFQVWAKPETPP